MLNSNYTNSNNAINQNKEMFQKMSQMKAVSNKTHLMNSYYSTDTYYYNDETQKKKEKNKKLNKILGLSFAGVTSLGILSTVIIQGVRGKLDLSKYFKHLSETKVVKNTTKFAEEKILKNKYVQGGLNVAMNFANFKDDACSNIVNWLDKKGVPGVKRIDDGLKKFYHYLSKKKFKAPYNDALENMKKAGVDTSKIPDFDTWYDNMNKDIQESLLKDKTVTFEILDKDMWSKLKGENKKEAVSNITKKITGDVISEVKLKKDGLRNKYLTGIEIKEDMSDEAKAAIERFNEIKIGRGRDIFERIRDTNLGNATTDALGIATSLGLLGGTIATSENKEERKSTMLNLGIPLLTTLGFAILGTLNCLSGAVSLGVGSALGGIASVLAKTIDNATKPKEEV